MHYEVVTAGITYHDLIVSGLKELPLLGEERHATGVHETWGGIANMARVCAALGMHTALATAAGEDESSQRMLRDMVARGLDVSLTHTHEGWALPLTVALSTEDDRAMVTVEEPPPSPVTQHLDSAAFTTDAVIVDLRDPVHDWLVRARRDGAVVYASRGFDPSDAWDLDAVSGLEASDVWMLNELEARAFTRCEDVRAAASQLAERVPLVVVTRGARGMIAVDSAHGEIAEADAFPVAVRTTTGAGDATLAALTRASRFADLTLEQRLQATAFLVSAVLESAGGVASPPTIAELTQHRFTEPRREAVRRMLGELLR